MHLNKNYSRPQAGTSTGSAQFRVSYPKARKGEGVAKEVKVNATYGKYIFNFLKYIYYRHDFYTAVKNYFVFVCIGTTLLLSGIRVVPRHFFSG